MTTCDRHGTASVTFDGNSCPICESTNHTPKEPPAGHIPIPAALQFAAACIQVGAGVLGLLNTGRAAVAIDPSLNGDPGAEAMKKQIDAGRAMADAALSRVSSRLVTV